MIDTDEYYMGVDWATGEDETVVHISRYDEEGNITVIGDLRGEIAEYIVSLHKEYREAVYIKHEMKKLLGVAASDSPE